MSSDLNLDAPALTKREAVKVAYERVGSVVWYALDQGLDIDRVDKQSLRTALRMLELVMKE